MDWASSDIFISSKHDKSHDVYKWRNEETSFTCSTSSTLILFDVESEIQILIQSWSLSTQKKMFFFHDVHVSLLLSSHISMRLLLQFWCKFCMHFIWLIFMFFFFFFFSPSTIFSNISYPGICVKKCICLWTHFYSYLILAYHVKLCCQILAFFFLH